LHEDLKKLMGSTISFEEQQESGFDNYYEYKKRPIKITISKPDCADWHYEIEVKRGKSFWKTLGSNKTLEGLIAEIKREYKITCNIQKKRSTQMKLSF